MKSIATFTASALLLSAAAFADNAALPPAAAKTHAAAERGKVSGTVTAVDAGANTISVKTADGVKTFSLSPTTRIVRGGKPARVTDIVAGAKVQALRYDRKTNAAIRIEL
jgi:hypothetical protein